MGRGGGLLTPFVAGRACQAALVGPELVEPRHTRQGFRQRQRDLGGLRVVEPDEGRGELLYESIVGVAWIQHDGQHRLLVALGIDVHEMQLSAGAVVVNGVVSWGVDVPAGQVDGLVVVSQGRVVSVHPLGVLYGKCRTVPPVPEISHRLVGIVEGRDVVQRKPVVEAERDWRLLGSSLAKLVLWQSQLADFRGCGISLAVQHRLQAWRAPALPTSSSITRAAVGGTKLRDMPGFVGAYCSIRTTHQR